MICLLLLGPSGVGKSTLSPPLAAALNCQPLDLDHYLARQWPTQPLADSLRQQGPAVFYQHSERALQTLHTAPEPYLVDMGAGTQWAAQGQTGFLNDAPSLCLWAEPGWLWQRNQRLRQDPRSLEAFKATEYSLWRQQIYQHCTYWLDGTQKTPQELLHNAQQLLQSLI